LYESKAKGIYNIGTGVARSWNDLAKSVFNSLDLPQKIEYIDMPSNLINQYQNHTQANITKLLNKVEHNFFTLEEAVKDYTNNYLQESWQYI
jgi:ADP-L-glycero-D-manno-heptose 6-epimerase